MLGGPREIEQELQLLARWRTHDPESYGPQSSGPRRDRELNGGARDNSPWLPAEYISNMYEDVLTGLIGLHEAVALMQVEPLDGASRHEASVPPSPGTTLGRRGRASAASCTGARPGHPSFPSYRVRACVQSDVRGEKCMCPCRPTPYTAKSAQGGPENERSVFAPIASATGGWLRNRARGRYPVGAASGCDSSLSRRFREPAGRLRARRSGRPVAATASAGWSASPATASREAGKLGARRSAGPCSCGWRVNT